MSKRFVTLPNGNRCGLGVYVASWRTILTTIADKPHASVSGFDHFPDDATRVLRQLRNGMHDRINRHLPWYGQGRKWDSDYQTRLRRDSRRLQDIARRIRVYQFETVEAFRRFADRLATRED